MALTLEVADEVPPAQPDAVRRHFDALSEHDVRATVRRAHGGRRASPFVVDASLNHDGRTLAAHTSGPSPRTAAERAAERLQRQLRRVIDVGVALRKDPRTLRRARTDVSLDQHAAPPKPPEERQIVQGRNYADHPESTYEAIADLIDDDARFHLFVHVRTGEDVVVHRIDYEPRRVELLHPPHSVLADETDDVVLATPSRYSRPLTLAQARAEMDILVHRFLYFTDADDARGKVLYLRRDGDYGLVEPE
jgi:ribosome-associated translation inhibitor RaiA